MSLSVEMIARNKITALEMDEMYSLFTRYYRNTSASSFAADLDEKTWVILLIDDQRRIAGFSTQQLYRHSGKCNAAQIIYSGDTVVDRSFRRNGKLAGAFGHLMIRTIQEHPDFPIYWLLTSKGARTYRFLPVFFKSFYPVHDLEIPADIHLLMNEIAGAKFGLMYSPGSHIVHRNGKGDCLVLDECETKLMRRSDPHIHFFTETNPGYISGDELVCLTEVSRDNLNDRAWRVIEQTAVFWRE